MSRIIIHLEAKSAATVTQLKTFKQIWQIGLSEARTRFSKPGVLAEALLFQNNHAEVRQQLQATIKLLKDADTRVSIYELEEEESFQDPSTHQFQKIDVETLQNILEAYEDD